MNRTLTSTQEMKDFRNDYKGLEPQDFVRVHQGDLVKILTALDELYRFHHSQSDRDPIAVQAREAISMLVSSFDSGR